MIFPVQILNGHFEMTRLCFGSVWFESPLPFSRGASEGGVAWSGQVAPHVGPRYLAGLLRALTDHWGGRGGGESWDHFLASPCGVSWSPSPISGLQKKTSRTFEVGRMKSRGTSWASGGAGRFEVCEG